MCGEVTAHDPAGPARRRRRCHRHGGVCAEQAYFAAQGAPDPQAQEQALDRVIGSYDGTAGATQAAYTLTREDAGSDLSVEVGGESAGAIGAVPDGVVAIR